MSGSIESRITGGLDTNSFLALSGGTLTGPLAIAGSTDAVQLQLTGNGTQTNNILDIKTSGSTDLFNVDNSGDVYVAGTLRQGTTSPIGNAEGFSNNYALSAPQGSGINAAFQSLATLTSASNGTLPFEGGLITVVRKNTAASSLSETISLIGLTITPSINLQAAQTYTNTNQVTSLNLHAIVNTNASTLAISNYSGIVFTDTVATGTYKTGLRFGTVSGATNNACISDNVAYSGTYFINSSSTNPSVFSGAMTIGSGTTQTHALNSLLATNGVQTATLLNLPAAATSGNPNGWLTMTINGTTSYIPFWH